MQITRRETMKLLTIAAAAVAVPPLRAAATGPMPRMPLEEFVQDARLLAGLRKGVRAMKRRKPSDPLSWFYQAAIHGVTPDAIATAAKDDDNVNNVFRKRYWNQCPHDGENSANFLPWHRGYTYYFEKILRLHTELDEFSLPYWNYTDSQKRENRKFPREFGIQFLDGNPNNKTDDNINPLYLSQRDFYFTSYEHPFAQGLPLLELSDGAVDITLPMNSPVFFGETEREGLGGGIADEDPSTRGLLESYPHDHIHRAVGGIIPLPNGDDAVGAMATPPTAGFDPIFPVHHANIDWLWVQWSCKPTKSWGKLPSAYWFDERPWFFFDTDGKVVNEPRINYFDHRALGIRFKYEDMTCEPLALPSGVLAAPAARIALAPMARALQFIAHSPTPFVVPTVQRTVVPLMISDQLHSAMTSIRAQAFDGLRQRLFVRLQDVRLGTVAGTGFDVHLTADANVPLTRTSPTFVGSIALFRHAMNTGDHAHPIMDDLTETFDISRAVTAVEATHMRQLKLAFVPYALLTVPTRETIFVNRDALNVSGVQFLAMQ